ncbi:hypothetical protein BO99DRAFT_176094 [Aspergillus violaceofuscus CBS 115571]|uniref:Uncharacterized protein n=1 Tax=Aspergillus violaceofuscus (strain CBS 115571) TaxID=1450538 RepID=A0A2V5H7L5_ASPV1|nr:hypothetical protein BO99DRAFT_176094 [Aspergillus violaceofuscus CBS 115571]
MNRWEKLTATTLDHPKINSIVRALRNDLTRHRVWSLESRSSYPSHLHLPLSHTAESIYRTVSIHHAPLPPYYCRYIGDSVLTITVNHHTLSLLVSPSPSPYCEAMQYTPVPKYLPLSPFSILPSPESSDQNRRVEKREGGSGTHGKGFWFCALPCPALPCPAPALALGGRAGWPKAKAS